MKIWMKCERASGTMLTIQNSKYAITTSNMQITNFSILSFDRETMI